MERQLPLFNWTWRRQVFAEFRVAKVPIILIRTKRSRGGYTDIWLGMRDYWRRNDPVAAEKAANSSNGRRLRNSGAK